MLEGVLIQMFGQVDELGTKPACGQVAVFIEFEVEITQFLFEKEAAVTNFKSDPLISHI